MALEVGRGFSSILFIATSLKIRERFPKDFSCEVFEASSLSSAQLILKNHPNIQVILSGDIHDFEVLKHEYPDPVRILMVSQINVHMTQNAINRGEIFRFVLESCSDREIFDAISQGISHFDIVQEHKKLLRNLKTQNFQLEKIIEKLEKQVRYKTVILKTMEGELHKSKRYLEQLNALIAWINASTSVSDLERRIEEAMKGILPVEKIFLTEHATAEFVKRLKQLERPLMVMPLIHQRKNLGHLYFVFRDEETSQKFYEKLELMKQISDTVALTLEKIHIFNLSVKRKEEWEKAFDAIKDPVALVNQNYQIVRANAAYGEVSGVKIQNLVGQKCYEVFQKRQAPCEGCKLQEALTEKEHQSFDLKSAAQNTYYATSAFLSESPQEKGVVMYYRNQGEEKELQNQLIQSEKMAEIGILAGSVAHEINNPLGGILAFTQILLQEVPKKDAIYKDLKEIEKATLRSKDIVENLLYFSRASRLEDKKEIHLSLVIEKALALIGLKIKHRNIKVYNEISKLPVVFGDFNQLVQVFLNLFQNALEAVPKKGWIRIDAHYSKSTKNVVVEIQDNGQGIPQETLSKIFNPFFTTKNKAEHPGLGLSVGYRIMRDHHGELIAKNHAPIGTKFLVYLPSYQKKAVS